MENQNDATSAPSGTFAFLHRVLTQGMGRGGAYMTTYAEHLSAPTNVIDCLQGAAP